MNISLEERFNRHWMPEPFSGCWLWTRGTAGRYGAIRVNHKQTPSHRIAWELFKGEIPAGMWVLHHCDTPTCVNPEHLFLGTHGDNVRDKINKGRGNNQYTKKKHQ